MNKNCSSTSFRSVVKSKKENSEQYYPTVDQSQFVTPALKEKNPFKRITAVVSLLVLFSFCCFLQLNSLYLSFLLPTATVWLITQYRLLAQTVGETAK